MDISIIGLGLIGGSLARACKKYTSCNVAGIDTNSETQTLAKLSGAIDRDAEDGALGASELVLLAIRPASAVEWLRQNATALTAGTVVVDLCGVKRSVSDAMSEIAKKHSLRYVGGHPMAGREKGGFANSSSDLFMGASMLLVPSKDSDPETLEMLEGFFKSVGFSDIVFTTAQKHDEMIACTSQLLHLMASAYMLSPKAKDARGFSGGAFRDMTRIADMDCDMWTELFLANADLLSEELRQLTLDLDGFKRAIDTRNEEELKALLLRGKKAKEATEVRK